MFKIQKEGGIGRDIMKEKEILTTRKMIEEIKCNAYRLGKVDEIGEELKLISQMNDLKLEEKYIDELYEEICK